MHKLTAALLGSAALAAQQEYWVDPVNGVDGNPGSYTLPLRTLTYAAGTAGPNAKIHLLPGLYGPAANGETLPITLGAIPQQNLVVRGVGTVVIDLAGSIQPLFRLMTGATGARLTNLEIRNSDQLGWWTRAINSGSAVNSANAANAVEIDRCRFVNLNRGFVLWTADNVQGWQVHDNLFVNLTNDAILEYTGTNAFYNNTFYGGAYKAYISDSTTSTCCNNLVVNYNIAFECNNASYTGGNHRNNWLYGCTINAQGAGFASGLPASNVLNQDPQLVNPALGDFHPQATSPLQERGTPAIFARADLDGNARLVDSDRNGSLLPEIGCYELTPLSLGATWDPLNRLLVVTAQSAVPGTFGFVLFCFDDGLVQLPGQGPILIDQPTLIPAFLSSGLPHTWPLSLAGTAPFVPGTRIVMFLLGIGPGHVGSALLGGNQVWVQL